MYIVHIYVSECVCERGGVRAVRRIQFTYMNESS